MEIKGYLRVNKLHEEFAKSWIYDWTTSGEDGVDVPVAFIVPDEIVNDVYENELGQKVYELSDGSKRLECELIHTYRDEDVEGAPAGAGRPVIILTNPDRPDIGRTVGLSVRWEDKE